MYAISDVGVALIKQFEGCRLNAYRDVVNVLTIGIGHTGPDVHEGMAISQAEADSLLRADLQRFEDGVNGAIQGAPTTQAQFDAMTSLCFNIGVGGFHNSSVCRHHREGNYTAAADAFPLWNMAGGKELAALTKRRLAEEKLYLSELPTVGAPKPAPDIPKNIPPAYTRADCARDMQGALVKAGFDPGPADGLWGRQSRTAYNRFNQGA